MRKVSEEEIEWIRDNKEEFIKSLSDTVLELDYQINSNREELDSLPTPDDRRKWVKDMLEKIVRETQNEGLKNSPE
jgi:hypothetical protein